jgi:hypothetical protein
MGAEMNDRTVRAEDEEGRERIDRAHDAVSREVLHAHHR